MSAWEEVLPGLQRLSLLPFDLLNVYLLGDVLVDSGSRFGAGRLLAALESETVKAPAVKAHAILAHALTHAHMDHQGASHQVCQHLGIPLWCGEADRQAMESGDQSSILADPRSLVARLDRYLAGPAHPVARSLHEGDEVGGFRVVAAPGHTPGHLAFWREADRALVAGDVLFHRNPLTLRTGLMEPFRAATYDPAQNRASARKLAALGPEVICFGHGPPLRDGAAFARFAAGLPEV
jgi:hydroxyacylglutathione hydrolase